ncbi:MAG: DUF2330 domain-containing protein [Candidatus Eisenbacteria bacterium]
MSSLSGFTGRNAWVPLAGVALALTATAGALIEPTPANSMCVPFPCDQCWVSNSGQLNLVVMDRDEGVVRLIPNIRFVGESPVIALIVPTPQVPTLLEAPARIWSDASALTAPTNQSFDGGSFGCTGEDAIPVYDTGNAEDGVVILAEQTVGGFTATTIASDDTAALVDWLVREGFEIDSSEQLRFAPLVDDGWVFTAMKSDSTIVMPTGGWDANVNPVEFRWTGDVVEVPFGVLQINTQSQLPMTFYVVDEHRSALADFSTSYANRISRSEAEAIQSRYPGFAGYIREGDFVTRLDRTFFLGDPMSGRFAIEWAPTDEEFRQGRSGSWIFRSGWSENWLTWLLAFSGILVAFRWGLEFTARRVRSFVRPR